MQAFESDLEHERGYCSSDVDLIPKETYWWAATDEITVHGMLSQWGPAEEGYKQGYKLIIPLGVDTNGKGHYKNIITLEHILMTGITGSGKSNFGKVIISSLMATLSPLQVNFVLFDFKQTEFTSFTGSPYLKTSVITQANDAFVEIDRLIAEKQNRLLKSDFGNLPYIVVLIDTFSDWMNTDKVSFVS